MAFTAAVYLGDQNPQRDRSLGITRATLTIARSLQGRVRLTEVVSASSVRLPEEMADQTVVLPVGTASLPTRVAVDALHPLVRPDADVWFYPKGFVSTLLSASRPTLALVHDTILAHYAEHYPGDRSKLATAFWLRQLRNTLRRADRLATVSETAKSQILRFAERSRIRPPEIDVVYATSEFEPQAPMRAASPYALHLGASAPHKRTAWLLRTWRGLLADGADLPPLHIVGRLPDDLAASVEAMPHAVVHGYVSDEELIRLYRGASVLVFPSEIEGFGLPLLEAYALGTPVVYARGTAVEEIAQAGTTRGAFDLDDPASLAGALDETLSMPDDEIEAAQRALGETYSGSRLGERVEAALRAAA